MIEFRHIDKTFQTSTGTFRALHDINLKVAAGKIYGIIGKSGAGKSTLIRCANLLERPTQGQVFIAGQDLTTLPQDQLRVVRRQIGMIFQHFNLLSTRSVYENIALPLELSGHNKTAIEQIINPLLELTGLTEKKDSYPAALSGGQKQRVAIARALASKPKVLLCDEATSALDLETTKSILQLLKDINVKLGLTILLITHEMDVIKEICDEVALLDKGEIIEQAEILEFFTKPKTQLAANIVKACLKHGLPPSLQNLLQPTPSTQANAVLRIILHGRSSDKPLVASLMQLFQIKLNILQANIEILKDKTVGIIVAEVSDDHNNLEQGLAYLRAQDATAEIMEYVQRTST